MLNYLIEKGVNLEQKDKFKRPPMYLAVRGEKPEQVKVYLNAGVDINVSSHLGRTPLMKA
jgi:ankyrin repeat protein